MDATDTPVTTATPKAKGAGAKAKAAKEAGLRLKQAQRASMLLKHVSDPTRLQVVLTLAQGERHVGALCEQFGQSQPAVSHHLALLRHGGIIAPRRQGKNNFYGLTDTGSELARVVNGLIRLNPAPLHSLRIGRVATHRVRPRAPWPDPPAAGVRRVGRGNERRNSSTNDAGQRGGEKRKDPLTGRLERLRFRNSNDPAVLIGDRRRQLRMSVFVPHPWLVIAEIALLDPLDRTDHAARLSPPPGRDRTVV